jgi:dTDP-4-amino-4,6-dideoxygalactose transaminase
MQTQTPFTTIPFVDLKAQYSGIQEEIDAAIQRVIGQSAFILGQEVQEFEEAFADYCGTRYAVGVDCGLSALELALRGFDIGPGDEVITAANTFIATALAVSAVGARVVLVDIDPDTYNIDPDLLQDAITRRTRAIIPVHLYGQPADMDRIMAIADRYRLAVIEDACQAHGATYKGKRAGSLGHAAAFSFYPSKNLGAYGDGGMLVTDDICVYNRAQILRNYGQTQKYHHLERGYNHRLDALQAAVLHVKLAHLDAWSAQRAEHSRTYHALLRDSAVTPPEEADYASSVWHLYVVRSQRRDELMAHLRDQGIATGIHYPVPVHLQPAYECLGYYRGDFPVTEQYAGEILSLPMYPELTEAMIAHVAGSIKAFC